VECVQAIGVSRAAALVSLYHRHFIGADSRGTNVLMYEVGGW